MKRIKLNEETTKKFKEALDVFMVNPKNGNEMLDKIYDGQQQQKERKEVNNGINENKHGWSYALASEQPKKTP